MIGKKPKVTAIILNWNRKDDTVDCLKSLSRTYVYGFDLSIIVVDNGSTDGSIEAFNHITSIPFRVIETGSNLGFAAGNNLGIKAALEEGTDCLLLLNNDTLVDRSLVYQLVKVIEREKTIGMVSPKIYFAPGFEFHKDRYPKGVLGRVIWCVGGKIDWANMYGTNFGVDEVDRGQYDTEREIDFANGACVLVKRKVFEDVGLFDGRLFTYMEDLDLSLRAKERGYKVVYTPNACLWHKVAQSSGIGSELNDYYLSRNRMLIGFRYASPRTKLALVRESFKLLFNGRKYQKLGIRDFYLGRFGKGSWR